MKCWAHQHEDKQLTRKHLTFLSIFKVIQTAPPQPNHCCHPEAIMSGKMNWWRHCTHTVQLHVNSVSQSNTPYWRYVCASFQRCWVQKNRWSEHRGDISPRLYLCYNCVPGKSEVRNEFFDGYWWYLGSAPVRWWQVFLVTNSNKILYIHTYIYIKYLFWFNFFCNTLKQGKAAVPAHTATLCKENYSTSIVCNIIYMSLFLCSTSFLCSPRNPAQIWCHIDAHTHAPTLARTHFTTVPRRARSQFRQKEKPKPNTYSTPRSRGNLNATCKNISAKGQTLEGGMTEAQSGIYTQRESNSWFPHSCLLRGKKEKRTPEAQQHHCTSGEVMTRLTVSH